MKKQTQAEKMQCENGSEVTKEQETTANTSEKDDATDNVTGAEGAAPGKEISKENEYADFETKYNELNDSVHKLKFHLVPQPHELPAQTLQTWSDAIL